MNLILKIYRWMINFPINFAHVYLYRYPKSTIEAIMMSFSQRPHSIYINDVLSFKQTSVPSSGDVDKRYPRQS